MPTVTYEHRVNPANPTQVQVRRVACRHLHPRGRDQRPWDEYMSCDTPQQAAHVLMLLRHGEPESVVYP